MREAVVLLDLSCLEIVPWTGVERTAVDLALALPRAVPEGRFVFVARRRLPPEIRASERVRRVDAHSLLPRPLFRRLVLPRIARAAGADILVSPVAAAAYASPARSVATIHDLGAFTAPEGGSGLRSALSRRAIRQAASRADVLVCVSEATRAALLARFPAAAGRTRVATPGVDPGFFAGGATADAAAEARRLLDLPAGPWAAVVGTVRRRRDLPVIARALEILDARGPAGIGVVWVGASVLGPRGVRRELGGFPAAGRIRFPGFVPREILPGFLHGASVLIAPSPHEGFGLPVLEAMAAGTPVIACRSGGLPEAGGDAALYFDPGDAEGLAEQLRAVIRNPEIRADRARLGRGRAGSFSVEESARRHWCAWVGKT